MKKTPYYIYYIILCILHSSAFSYIKDNLDHEYLESQKIVSFSVITPPPEVDQTSTTFPQDNYILTDQMWRNLKTIIKNQEEGPLALVPIQEIQLENCPDNNHFTISEESLSDIQRTTGLYTIPFNCNGFFLDENQKIALPDKQYVQGFFFNTPDQLYYISFVNGYLYQLEEPSFQETEPLATIADFPDTDPEIIGIGYQIQSKKINSTVSNHIPQEIKSVSPIPFFYTTQTTNTDPPEINPQTISLHETIQTHFNTGKPMPIIIPSSIPSSTPNNNTSYLIPIIIPTIHDYLQKYVTGYVIPIIIPTL